MYFPSNWATRQEVLKQCGDWSLRVRSQDFSLDAILLSQLLQHLAPPLPNAWALLE